MLEPATLTKEISPPPISGSKSRAAHSAKTSSHSTPTGAAIASPSLAAVKAGEAEATNHLAYFAAQLAAKSRLDPQQPRISIQDLKQLYQRNQHDNGHHFVVHQHNHPIAGVHYDLRLQFSQDSSVSFAIPYGLPGNPNTQRPSRMAIETRVHNLWNNLIESASHASGSLLIWDTGEYEVLDRYTKAVETDDERSNVSDVEGEVHDSREPENHRLIKAFGNSQIRLRLHGTRLPTTYTLTLRLPFENRTSDRISKPPRKRRRIASSTKKVHSDYASANSEPEVGAPEVSNASYNLPVTDDATLAAASEDEDEDMQVRSNNAYTGATNSIGSIHQRRWYLSLDKEQSGFVKVKSGKDKGIWKRDRKGGGFETFFVNGVEVERSIVTGRRSDEVMEDEGVKGFIPRRMWRPVLE